MASTSRAVASGSDTGEEGTWYLQARLVAIYTHFQNKLSLWPDPLPFEAQTSQGTWLIQSLVPCNSS